MSDTQTLRDSFLPFRVKYAGLITDVQLGVADPTGRTELLKLLDEAQRQSQVTRDGYTGDDAVLELNAYSIRVVSGEASTSTSPIPSSEIILTAPIHVVASVGYIFEEGLHILAIRIGDYGGMGVRQRQQKSVSARIELNDLCVLYTFNQDIAECICNTFDKCFQVVFTEMAVKTAQDRIMPGPVKQPSSRHSRPSGPTTGSSSLSSRHRPSFGRMSSNTTMTSSDRSTYLAEMTNDYMTMLFAVLTADEVREFLTLFRSWINGDRPIGEVAYKMLELFGQERKHLLASELTFQSFENFKGLRPFIKPTEKRAFEHFLEQHSISDNAASSMTSWSPASDSNTSNRIASNAALAVECNTSLLLMATPPHPMNHQLTNVSEALEETTL